MPTAVFRLLLALSLVLNGLSPVWAMKPMGHGSHEAQRASTAAVAAARQMGQHDHASMHGHAGMPGHASKAAIADSGGDSNDKHSGACCDDPAACHCGCVLPPAMLLSTLTPMTRSLPAAPQPRYFGGLARALFNPPFRPPLI